MPDERASDDDQSSKSPDVTAQPPAGDPADLAGLAADERVDQQEDEVDRLAVEAEQPS